MKDYHFEEDESIYSDMILTIVSGASLDTAISATELALVTIIRMVAETPDMFEEMVEEVLADILVIASEFEEARKEHNEPRA